MAHLNECIKHSIESFSYDSNKYYYDAYIPTKPIDIITEAIVNINQSCVVPLCMLQKIIYIGENNTVDTNFCTWIFHSISNVSHTIPVSNFVGLIRYLCRSTFSTIEYKNIEYYIGNYTIIKKEDKTILFQIQLEINCPTTATTLDLIQINKLIYRINSNNIKRPLDPVLKAFRNNGSQLQELVDFAYAVSSTVFMDRYLTPEIRIAPMDYNTFKQSQFLKSVNINTDEINFVM